MRCFVSLLVLLTLSACGGGGGGTGSASIIGSVGAASTVSAASTMSTVSGVAAIGAGISGRIFLVDSSGQTRYVDTTDGHFSFKLTGMQSPVLLKAQWTNASGSQHLYSFASADGVVNITPLTHLAVLAASGATSPDSLYAAPSASSFAVLQGAMPVTISRLQSLLQPLMARYGVANTNPISSSFLPDSTGMDALLDQVLFSYVGNSVLLSDKATGATLLSAPLSNLLAAVSAATWGIADAVRAADVGVAINAQGQGLAVWSEMAATQQVLKARWMNGLDLGLVLSGTGDAAEPRVAMDAAGDALVVWAEYSAKRSAIWARRYSASALQWGAPRLLSSSSAVASAHLPDLALDAAGNALVAWYQGDGRGYHSDGWAAQYAVDQDSWSAPTLVTDGFNNATGLRVVLNAAGQGLMAWQQERGDGGATESQPVDVWARPASTAVALETWGKGSIVSGGLDHTAYVYGQLALAVNVAADAALLWSQRLLPSLPMKVQAALFKAGSGWQAATSVTLDSTEDCHEPAVALDDAGNAIAVWQQQTDYGAYGGSNRYTAGVGWGTAGHFVDSKLGDAFMPSVATDALGNATVVWYRWSPTNAIDLMISHYQPSSGWADAQVFAAMGSKAAMTQSQPRVAANAVGQTLLLWGMQPSAVASWL